uniref:Uncharacterized protein n=1 Tax=Panagrolaimus superbus TaxID=310955 RepID=A0A914YZK3_9BILA
MQVFESNHSLEWEPLDLFLSHHSPKSKVAIRSSGTNPEKVFIHGTCNVSGCTEQVHLYELDFSVLDQNNIEYTQIFTERSIDTPIPIPITSTPTIAVKKTPTLVEYINVARDMFAKNKAPSTKPKIILRKEKGYSNASSMGSGSDLRMSTPSLHSCLTNLSGSSDASNRSGR